MQRAVLEQILRHQPGVTPREDGFVVTEAAVVDLLVSAGHEVLTLSKVREFRLQDAYLTAVADKSETYYLEYEQVLALRAKPGSGRTGFST